MLAVSPFDVTVYLDADCVVLGSLDLVFNKVEKFGMACCIGECPWLSRYGCQTDELEYSTGVLAFDGRNPDVAFAMRAWDANRGNPPSASRWLDGMDRGKPVLKGMDYEDQASFSLAVGACGVNPFVLPPNYNFHPGIVWDRAFFPIKVWHSPHPVPEWVEKLNHRIESGQQFVELARVSK